LGWAINVQNEPFLMQNREESVSFIAKLMPAGGKGSVNNRKWSKDTMQEEFTIPYGKYYLCNAGYALQDGYITLYKGVR